jgi:hypothetical protein
MNSKQLMKDQVLRKLTTTDGQQLRINSAERRRDYLTICSKPNQQEQISYLSIVHSIQRECLDHLRVQRISIRVRLTLKKEILTTASKVIEGNLMAISLINLRIMLPLVAQKLMM